MRSGASALTRRVFLAGCGSIIPNDMLVRKSSAIGALVMALVLHAGSAFADASGDPSAVKEEDGKYYDVQGNPTYKVASEGTVDWYTYSGFRRYHSDCHTCHGPDGEGSSYAPALKNSPKTMSYADFANLVVNGRKNVTTSQENVMPAFGTNQNVMCYLDDIFVYLRARANDAVPRGRPQKHADKPKSAEQSEKSCMGQ
jgi:methanol metabolism-related c-type cytochrome